MDRLGRARLAPASAIREGRPIGQPQQKEPMLPAEVWALSLVRDNFDWRDLRGLGKLLAYVFAVHIPTRKECEMESRRECRRKSSPNR